MEYRATVKYTFSDEREDYPSDNDNSIETSFYVKDYNDLKKKIESFIESEEYGPELTNEIKDQLYNEEIGLKVEFIFNENVIKLECHECQNPYPNDSFRVEEWNLTVFIYKE